jgi:hypothetical protein
LQIRRGLQRTKRAVVCEINDFAKIIFRNGTQVFVVAIAVANVPKLKSVFKSPQPNLGDNAFGFQFREKRGERRISKWRDGVQSVFPREISAPPVTFQSESCFT